MGSTPVGYPDRESASIVRWAFQPAATNKVNAKSTDLEIHRTPEVAIQKTYECAPGRAVSFQT